MARVWCLVFFTHSVVDFWFGCDEFIGCYLSLQYYTWYTAKITHQLIKQALIHQSCSKAHHNIFPEVSGNFPLMLSSRKFTILLLANLTAVGLVRAWVED